MTRLKTAARETVLSPSHEQRTNKLDAVLLLLHSDLKDFSADTLLSLLSCGGSVA